MALKIILAVIIAILVMAFIFVCASIMAVSAILGDMGETDCDLEQLESDK